MIEVWQGANKKRRSLEFNGGGGAVRILIVEDDKALVRGLSASLKAMGFAVDHEPDGAEAASIAIS